MAHSQGTSSDRPCWAGGAWAPAHRAVHGRNAGLEGDAAVCACRETGSMLLFCSFSIAQAKMTA